MPLAPRRKRARGSATASSLFTAKTMLGTLSKAANKAWRRVCASSFTGLLQRVEFGDVHQHHGGVAAGGGGHHVARVLLVARRVGDDELAFWGREIAKRHVDRDALFAFGLQPVGQQRQVETRPTAYRSQARSALFERIDLIGQDGAAVVQQPADQRALAVVHRTRGQEAQRPVVRHGGSGGGARIQSVHQK